MKIFKSGMPSFFNRDLSLLFSGYTVSALGTAIYEFMLMWWILQQSGSSFIVGVVMVASSLPMAVFGPLCGVVSDRCNKKYIIVISDLVSGVLSFFMALMVKQSDLNLINVVLVTFLITLSSAFFKPSVRGIMPSLAEKKQLKGVNAFLNTIKEVVKVVAPLAGGLLLLVSDQGIYYAFLINSISFALSAVSEMFIRYEHHPHSGEPFLKNFTSGLRYLISHRKILKSVLFASGLNFFLVGIMLFNPVIVSEIFVLDGSFFSLCKAFMAAGSILVSILLSLRINSKLGVFFQGIIFVIAASCMAVCIYFDVPVLLLVSLFLMGFSVAGFNIEFFTYIQSSVDQEYLGRIFSVVISLASITAPLGYLIFGFLGDIVLHESIYIVNIFIALFGLILMKNKGK